MPEADQLAEENQRLKKELKNLQQQREKEKNEFESKIASEREAGKGHQESAMQRTQELEAMKSKMVKLTRQLDEEVQKRDQVSAESQQLERRLQDLTKGTAGAVPASPTSGTGDEQALRERGSQVSTKLMRVVDQWMRQRDLQQALLRGASINDTAFATLVQALNDCPSLQTLDLSQNLLTMDSCSDLCQLITTAPSLSFISLAENLFSLRSVGYFMTAVMERQNTKKLMPLDLLDLQGNEGLIAAAAAPVPEALLSQVQQAMHRAGRLPPSGVELVAQVMRALWRFLHDTAHPQVKDASPDDVAFFVMDKITLRKMENALMKILLLGADTAMDAGSVQYRPVTANLAFASTLEVAEDPRVPEQVAREDRKQSGYASPTVSPQKPKMSTQEVRTQPTAADPFADLKTAFEPQREKLKTFNLKQIVTRNGTVLMNMLERLLETTEIDARDVETEQTLLEYACHTGNMGLAKLCYRRGANLSAKTQKGETAFNIVTQNKRYDLMEFLHTYGVKVNSADAKGRTALHVAAANDDVDGVCRLVEWGADVNIKDDKKRTPIHVSAASGNMKTTMLLLEVGADMNAKDDREYTAVAHAEANNHFVLMDRLVQLGGRGHGLHQKKENDMARSKSAKMIGELVVSAGLLKRSSLGRIGEGDVRPIAAGAQHQATWQFAMADVACVFLPPEQRGLAERCGKQDLGWNGRVALPLCGMSQHVEGDRYADFRVSRFYQRCMESEPDLFRLVTGTGTLGCIITFSICLRHSWSLDQRPLCMQRSYYHGMLAFPMVWAFCTWVTLWCPLNAPMSELFMGQSEAYAIYSFLVLLFMLVSIEALKRRRDGELDGSSYHSNSNMGEVIIQAVQAYGPQKYFAVPPLGCLFMKCVRPHHVTANQLLWVSRLVKQYGYAQVILNTCYIYTRQTMVAGSARAQVLATFENVLKVSGLLAVYGLFVMYKATHELLHDWKTTAKFLSVKLIIGLSTLQKMLLRKIVEVFPPHEGSCLLDPLHPKDLDRALAYWSSYLTLLETILLACLVIKAFPAEEVADYPLKNLDFVELELRQIHQKSRSQSRLSSPIHGLRSRPSRADSEAA
ncbi:Putative ankyrin repeat protein RF_0381 [Durusdinium trenchii]|uniref:Ankyrin repeat protein RF_0381 n=1 Tax=Durusdinium trenchii TaxID=1381693 RepID=A0ABP0M1S5_9DINO